MIQYNKLGGKKMKKQNVLNLIKYHVEKNENAFRNEAIAINPII